MNRVEKRTQLCICIYFHLFSCSGEVYLTSSDYAGDISPVEAWEMLKNSKSSKLVDVRTDSEWAFVGMPDLSSLLKELISVSWQLFPNMQENPEFVQKLRDSGIGEKDQLMFICRSGGRSRMAAIEMTSHGFKNCFNVSGGFEGDHNAEGHRGTVDGWKFSKLPWKQG